jgi:hypothetical protein
MNGETETGVRVQTASKAEVRYAVFPPAPQIKEEDEEEEEEDEKEERSVGTGIPNLLKVYFQIINSKRAS